MKHLTTAALAGAVSLALALSAAAAPPTDLKTKTFQAAQVLFWNQAQKEAYFPHMEDRFDVHTVKAGARVTPLPAGAPLGELQIKAGGRTLDVDQFMADQKTAGLLVIQDGKVRLEKYGLGYGPTGRWTSFSVAKSFSSTLLGAAIKDGYIQSVDEPVTKYLPGLKGSGYDGVTIRQILTMTSGVRWNEDYSDPKSDVARFFMVTPPPGEDPTVAYMKTLPREAAPGTKWVYKTGETNLIGVIVTAATHKTLADYLTEKVWGPAGMEQDAVWMVDSRGQEVGGCCLSVSLRDYGRMGMFMIGGARGPDGKSIVPDGWIAAATRGGADTGWNGYHYGYQWWTRPDGTYDAVGIFGQLIHIDPARKLVVVINSAWATAESGEHGPVRNALIDAISAAADRRS